MFKSKRLPQFTIIQLAMVMIIVGLTLVWQMERRRHMHEENRLFEAARDHQMNVVNYRSAVNRRMSTMVENQYLTGLAAENIDVLDVVLDNRRRLAAGKMMLIDAEQKVFNPSPENVVADKHLANPRFLAIFNCEISFLKDLLEKYKSQEDVPEVMLEQIKEQLVYFRELREEVKNLD